ncbi:minichromosome maintenance protein MCM [Halolamina pelagica]|uniref:Minichromosome maintenance protein MCM n=1 Tax=Halolamina pelagica TaxID=699431 RepID=A0A0P7HF24_9EURY|nr:MoxR family ATPase [Halolamina pelagica]KPN32306.1 minichromosome maintenance protein MCM [Halolamina pelagica]
MTDPAAFHDAVRDEASAVLIGNEEILEGLSIAALTRGHVLLEGVPGVAKTTIANLFARASGLEYTRIQMTPDILPADITGTHIYREPTGEFELQRGPVFANVVVADEINRATPKTQSALLEAMQEGTVTIEGDTLSLPAPFMVIATQNPIEMEGTFALPEAQRDRFQLKLTVDLPGREMERNLFDRFDDEPDIGPSSVSQVVTPEDLEEARAAVAETHVADPVREYILDLVRATRDSPDVEYGASPRATLAFLNAGKAAAAIDGRSYVIPDDIKQLAHPVLRHRLVLSTDAELGGESVDDLITGLLDSVPVPEEATRESAVADQPADS